MSDPNGSAQLPAQDTQLHFIVGTLPDGKIVLDFRRPVDHLKMTVDEASALCEGLVDAIRQVAAHGRVIETGRNKIIAGDG